MVTTAKPLPRTRPGVRLSEAALVAAPYLFSFSVIAGFPHLQAGFPLDDSWIHQVIARNLARYHTLGFIPGAWSSGSSSFLWTFVLAAKYLLIPPLSPLVYCGILNLLLLIAIGVGILAIARQDGLPEYLCLILAAAPACDGNFVWLACTGMEHVLFVAFSVASVYFWFKSGTRSTLLAAACLGALCFTRPEGILLGFGLAFAFRRHSTRTRKDLAIIASAVAVCAAVFLAVNFVTSRSWLPMTYAGRKWLYVGSARTPVYDMLNYPILVLIRSPRPWIATGTNWWAFPISILVIFGALRLCRAGTPRCAALFLWMAALVAAYAIMLPSAYQELRYQSVFLCLMLPLAYAGLDQLLTLLRMRTVPRIVGLGLLCAGLAIPSILLWRNITRAGITVVQQTHERAANYIAHSTPANSKIAAFDIGVLGYVIGGGRIKDLGGLTSSSYLPYMENGRILDYLHDQHIDYLMWGTAPDGSSSLPQMLTFGRVFASSFQRIAIFCAGSHAYELSNHIHSQCQAVYQRRAASQPSPLVSAMAAPNIGF